MIKRLLSLALISLWYGCAIAVDMPQLETPIISMEQAIATAKRHIATDKIEVSNMYLAKVEWQPRSGLVSFWRLEWRSNKLVKGGNVIVTVYADGKVEHGLGE